MRPKTAPPLSRKPDSSTSPEFKAARLWYQMEFANHSFEAVRDVLQSMLAGKLDEYSPQYYAMTVGLICIYARPFTNNKPVGKLSDEIVPAEFKNFHNTILTLRHQLFAHADASLTDGKETYPNEVVIENDGNEISINVARAIFRPNLLEGLASLVEALIKKTYYHRSKHAKQFIKPIRKVGKGAFRINVVDPSAPIFVKLSEAEKLARQKRINFLDPNSIVLS